MSERVSSALDQRGFTLAELLVVVVLGAIILSVTFQVLISNQRAYTVQRAQVSAQQTIRAGLDVLFGELREVSAIGGDIIAFDDQSLTVRSMRSFGVTCGVSYTPSSITVRRAGPWFTTTDSIVVFADDDVDLKSDDEWHWGIPSSVDTTATCGSDVAQRLTVPGMATAMGTDTIRAGAPVRSYRVYEYGLFDYSGDDYLGRQAPGGAVEPLVGPLEATTQPLLFEYLDENGNPTIVAADIAAIVVTLRTETGVLDTMGEMIGDSITARIQTRN